MTLATLQVRSTGSDEKMLQGQLPQAGRACKPNLTISSSGSLARPLSQPSSARPCPAQPREVHWGWRPTPSCPAQPHGCGEPRRVRIELISLACAGCTPVALLRGVQAGSGARLCICNIWLCPPPADLPLHLRPSTPAARLRWDLRKDHSLWVPAVRRIEQKNANKCVASIMVHPARAGSDQSRGEPRGERRRRRRDQAAAARRSPSPPMLTKKPHALVNMLPAPKGLRGGRYLAGGRGRPPPARPARAGAQAQAISRASSMHSLMVVLRGGLNCGDQALGKRGCT